LYFQQAANALKQFQVHFKSKIISMGHFTINLPDNRVGDVRYGKVRKLQFPFRWLFRKSSVDKTGYVVKLHPPSESHSEYRLFKTNDGRWFQDPDERISLADETAMAIKEAIEKRGHSR
jgi:hypothetical protein